VLPESRSGRTLQGLNGILLHIHNFVLQSASHKYGYLSAILSLIILFVQIASGVATVHLSLHRQIVEWCAPSTDVALYQKVTVYGSAKFYHHTFSREKWHDDSRIGCKFNLYRICT